MIAAEPSRSRAGSAFTLLVLEVFRFNGKLLAAGDKLVREFGLTSSLWQVLGAVGYVAGGPLTVAQIARHMGLARQSVQRSAAILAEKGLVTFEDNPDHKRAPLVTLTTRGHEVLEAVMAVQAGWADSVARGEKAEAIENAVTLMRWLSERL